MPENVLELRGATVLKGNTRVLDGLTLTIRSGEHTAIIGPNGAGKTTLINLLTHDDRAVARDDGVPPVSVFGSARWNVFDLRSKLGVVSTDLHQRFVSGNSFGDITAADAVLSGLFGTRGILHYVAVDEAMRRRAADALRRVDAGHLAGSVLSRMSTGEARRVLIARALVTEPAALVLDEPSAGLDLAARHKFLDTISRIAQSGVTVVLVTHHVEEIVPQIGRVVLLDRGRVAAAGAKSDVLRSDILTGVYGARVMLQQADGYYFARVG